MAEVEVAREGGHDALLDEVDEQLIQQLAEHARVQGLQLTGEGGLLARLTKTLVDSALEGEMDDHLGYSKHDPAGRNGGNSRNGRRGKTVLTESGPVEIAVPRDRDGSFEPKIVPKYARRLSGIEDMVISLSARGLTTGEISAHLAEVYGVSASKQLISSITDRVLEGMAEWQSRPLDVVYPVIFIDAVHVKIRDGNVANRPIYVALAVTVNGTRDILGLWAGDHGDGEGAKFWLRVLTEIKNRGTADVCLVVCDGLKGRADEPGPDRARPEALVQPVEGRAQRLRDHLRRPPSRRPQVARMVVSSSPVRMTYHSSPSRSVHQARTQRGLRRLHLDSSHVGRPDRQLRGRARNAPNPQHQRISYTEFLTDPLGAKFQAELRS
jgi:hypothetical protein